MRARACVRACVCVCVLACVCAAACRYVAEQRRIDEAQQVELEGLRRAVSPRERPDKTKPTSSIDGGTKGIGRSTDILLHTSVMTPAGGARRRVQREMTLSTLPIPVYRHGAEKAAVRIQAARRGELARRQTRKHLLNTSEGSLKQEKPGPNGAPSWATSLSHADPVPPLLLHQPPFRASPGAPAGPSLGALTLSEQVAADLGMGEGEYDREETEDEMHQRVRGAPSWNECAQTTRPNGR